MTKAEMTQLVAALGGRKEIAKVSGRSAITINRILDGRLDWPNKSISSKSFGMVAEALGMSTDNLYDYWNREHEMHPGQQRKVSSYAVK